jgi:hypothetical protein
MSSLRKWNLRYVVEDANNNANILRWVWLDGMFQEASVNKGYKKRKISRDYFIRTRNLIPKKYSLKCTSPERSTSYSCIAMFFTEIKQ